MTNKIASIAVEKGRKQITATPSGGISIEGPDGINLYRLLTIKSGMEFETRCPGMKLTRGPSCFTIAKREHGLKGNKGKVYRAFCTMHGFDMAEDVLAKL